MSALEHVLSQKERGHPQPGLVSKRLPVAEGQPQEETLCHQGKDAVPLCSVGPTDDD